ncbi:J domain-containing protein [Metabacillus fastidiosus]|uniref:J domain-containing protein n=1 Tax=Metabacillus fastidiosus TaxID=1458 RepID=UPI003D27985F
MSVWDILGIEPTDEISAIKKAYAKKLKIHHPEDDPEGYQRLREAYDSALKQQKERERERNNSVPILIEDHTVVQNFETVPPDNYEYEFRIPSFFPNWEDSFEEKEDPIDEFMSKVENLYADFPSRIDIDKWRELLNSDIIWNIELKSKISTRLLDFCQNHSCLPKQIWMLLEDSFHWSEEFQEEEEIIGEHTSLEFADYYKWQIDVYYPGLSYLSLINAENTDYDAFLYYREKGLSCLIADHLEEAEDWFTKAYNIFENDPDLLRLRGDLFYRLSRYEDAVESFKQHLSINSNDLDTRISLAHVLHYMKYINESAVQCEKVLAVRPGDADILSLYGKNLFAQGELNKSREIFKKLEKKNPNDIDVITYLGSIHGQMVKEKLIERRQNNRPSLRELKKELCKPNFIKKILLFLLFNLRIKVIVLIILSAMCWNIFHDMIYIHPLLFGLGLFLSLFTAHIDLGFMNLSDWSMFGLLAISLLFLLRELRKAYKVVRY